MKKIYPLCLFFLITSSLRTYSQTQDSLWIIGHYTKIERMVSMRDGIKLHTSIYIPNDTLERHPVLITRTPYASFPYGENKFSPRYLLGYQRYYLREGYIMVQQDVRGRWMSEGDFVDVRPFNPEKKDNEIDEASDTYDLIDWLLKNIPHHNGNVGVLGISYPGFYSTMAALSNHPALKAVSPQAPVTEWFLGDDFHHNGAFMLLDAFDFYADFGKPRPRPTMLGNAPFDFHSDDSYQFFLKAGAIGNLNRHYFHDSVAFWKDLFSHPNYDAWWKARNTRNFVGRIKPATLVVGGLFDAEDCYGAWRLYQAIETRSKNENRLVMGPWSHGQWAGDDGSSMGNIQFGGKTALWYQNNIEIPFFNFYLKGKGSLNALAEANVFVSGENQWHAFTQWPPREKSDRELFLHAGGKLNWTRPGDNSPPTSYISDPATPVPFTGDVQLGRTTEYMTDDQRFASRRPDVATFQTEVLTEDLTVTGTVIANLIVSTTGTDADFVVKIIDVFPDEFSYGHGRTYPMGGYQMLVRGEIMRGRFRKSFENPEAFTPRAVEVVRFELPDIAHRFLKGHRLMVQVQSSWFPLADRNPQKFVNIYTAVDSDYQPATITLYHDKQKASSIILPVLN
jgi:putative CocE/NonD family hydrolase